MTVEQDHERIYLQPKCCAEHAFDGRQWCQDPVWECECDEDYRKPIVEYVRADLALNTRATPPSPAGMAGLAERVRYILDPSTSAQERLNRRAHLTNHDLRTILIALTANGSQPSPEPVAWIRPNWNDPTTFDGGSPVSTYYTNGWLPLYLTANGSQPDRVVDVLERIANDIVRDVCELPGDDDIEADDTLIVSVDDLRGIVERNLATLDAKDQSND